MERLRCVESPYRIPFPDGFFDFCFSEQVLEHVPDLPIVLREIARVLKPGAISIHRFPGPNYFFEGHIRVPLPALCRFDWYLSLCAMLKCRGPGWKRQAAIHRTGMVGTVYPTKRQIRRYARDAGVSIEFAEREEFSICTVGGLARLRQRAERMGLGIIARAALPLIAQRYMIVRALSSH